MRRRSPSLTDRRLAAELADPPTTHAPPGTAFLALLDDTAVGEDGLMS